MDWRKYIIMFLICFCVGSTLWFVAGLISGTTYAFASAGLGFGIGWTGMEIGKDYVQKRINEKTNKP
jgi:hypothetical protein